MKKFRTVEYSDERRENHYKDICPAVEGSIWRGANINIKSVVNLHLMQENL